MSTFVKTKTENIHTTIDTDFDDTAEFIEIIAALEDYDLALLYQILHLPDETAQRQYMREKRPSKLAGTLYNAYTARVLVLNSLDFVQDEIKKRITSVTNAN